MLTALLAETLERSPAVAVGSVADALSPVAGVAASIAASATSAEPPFTLIAGSLDLDFHIVRGDDAFAVEENLEPVPGGASAPDDWVLYVRPPNHLTDAVQDAIVGLDHLRVGEPQRSQPIEASAAAVTIDESALLRLSGAE